MISREPGWWYAPRPTWAERLLLPASWIWSAVAARRLRSITPATSACPVLCIGNFTAGGTGKTPMAIYVAERLRERGSSPAFLTRGYGGRMKGPHWLDVERDRAADVGDEPLLLARAAPVMIARDRPSGARAIAARTPPHDMIVMDDGLQNPSLAKTLSLAVVDGLRGFGNGRVMPAGPLRMALADQLALVDAVVVNLPAGTDPAASPVARWLRDEFHGPVLSANTEPSGDVSWLAGCDVLAFSGIGAPQRFFDLLEKLGANLVERRVFADHHAFSPAEATRLLADAARQGAVLCTTEKDWVRLGPDGPTGELRHRARTLPIRMTFDPRDVVRMDTLLGALAPSAGRP